MFDKEEYESHHTSMRDDEIPYLYKSPNPSTFFASLSRQTLVQDLRSICSKTHYDQKSKLFYKSLLYLDIIISEVGMHPNLKMDFNLLLLTTLSLGIKFTQNQINILRLPQLQHISSKFSSYTSEEYLANEMLCVKLLNYRMVYSSAYDYFLMFISNNEYLLDKATEYLDQLAGHRFYLQRHPYVIACIIITYTMDELEICDEDLSYRFYYDKENPWYVKIAKAIGTSYKKEEDSQGQGKEKVNMHKTMNSYSENKRGMIDNFAKMTQMSKMKEKEMFLLNGNGDEVEDCNKRSDDDDRTLITNDSSSTCHSNSNLGYTNGKTHKENLESYKGLKIFREHSRRSCADVIPLSTSTIINSNDNNNSTMNNILRASTNILNCGNGISLKVAMNSNILRSSTNTTSITSSLLRNSIKRGNDKNNQTPTKLLSNNNSNSNSNSNTNEKKLDYKLNLDMDAFAKIHQRRTSVFNSAQKEKDIDMVK